MPNLTVPSRRPAAILGRSILLMWAMQFAGADSISAQSHEPILTAREDTPALVRIREILRRPITLEFVETPLGDVIEFLRDYTNVNIVSDVRLLEDEGVTRETPITISVKNIRLDSALRLLLRPIGATWVLANDCISITTLQGADKQIVTRSYPVADLAATAADGEALNALARQVFASAHSAPYHKPDAIRCRYVDSLKAIVLTEQVAIHDVAHQLFEDMRGKRETSDAVRRIGEKLNENVVLEFVETQLGDVVEFISDYAGINVVLDHAALADEGVNADTPVTVHVESIPLKSALNLLLGNLNATFHVDQECLIITSRLRHNEREELRVYDISKLVGERVRFTADNWSQLASLLVRGGPSDHPRTSAQALFTPGSSVQVAWGGVHLPATVADVAEYRYQVRFKVGDAELEEWVDSSRVFNPRSSRRATQPVVTYYEPKQLLVVYGSSSLQVEIEELVRVVAKTAERSGK